MARLEIPCLILDEDELKSVAAVGEWRQDRHNLEAARIFGGAPDTARFPTAFQRREKNLISRIKTAFRGPSVGEHHASAPAIDPKNIVSLRPNIN
jgi:hypothetical protein